MAPKHGIATNPAPPQPKEIFCGLDPDTPPAGWNESTGARAFAAEVSRRTNFRIDATLLYCVMAKGIHFISVRFDEAVRHVMAGPQGGEDELLRQITQFLRPGRQIIQICSPPPKEKSPPGGSLPAKPGEFIEPIWEVSWQARGIHHSIETRRKATRPLIQYRIEGVVVGEVIYFSTRPADRDYFDRLFQEAIAAGTLDEWFHELAEKMGLPPAKKVVLWKEKTRTLTNTALAPPQPVGVYAF